MILFHTWPQLLAEVADRRTTDLIEGAHRGNARPDSHTVEVVNATIAELTSEVRGDDEVAVTDVGGRQRYGERCGGTRHAPINE